MSYIPTEQDINMLKQKIKNVSIKINILNKNFSVIDSIEGTVISDNYSLNVDSDIRRTYSLTLAVNKDYDILSIYKKIWIDRLFQIFFGVEDLITNEIIWYPFGIFTFDNVTYTTDATNYNLQINCIDLVALLNGTLSGQISGTGLIIPAYDEETKKPNKIRDVMVQTITELGKFQKYNIADMDKDIPYDLEFSVGATIWEIITTLRDLYPGWETFFDTDGTFICRPIPTTETDPVYITQDIFNEMIISENLSDDMSSIRNVTKIFGQTLETDYYIDNISVSNQNNNTKIYEVVPSNSDNFIISNQYGIKTSFLTRLNSTDTNSDLFMFIKNKTQYYPLITSENNINNNEVYFINWVYNFSNNSYDNRENWFEIPNNYYVSNTITYEIKEDSVNNIKELYYNINFFKTDVDYLEIENNNYKNYLVLRELPIGNDDITTIYITINNSNPILLSTKFFDENTKNNEYTVPTYSLKQGETYILKREKYQTDLGQNKIYDYFTLLNKNNIIPNISNFSLQTVYKANISNLSLVEGTKIGFKIPEDCKVLPLISLNDSIYKITDVNGDYLNENSLISNRSYVFNYTNNNLVLYGQWQVMGMAKEVKKDPTLEQKEQDKINESCDNIIYIVNPDSPFTIEDVGELRQVLSGGEYENIYSDQLAIERAEYENWKATRLNDTITINNIMIPWLVGNEKVEYKQLETNIVNNYIIKQISGSVTTWTQTITMSKFYPLYPYVVNS